MRPGMGHRRGNASDREQADSGRFRGRIRGERTAFSGEPSAVSHQPSVKPGEKILTAKVAEVALRAQRKASTTEDTEGHGGNATSLDCAWDDKGDEGLLKVPLGMSGC